MPLPAIKTRVTVPINNLPDSTGEAQTTEAEFVSFDLPDCNQEHVAILFPGWDQQDMTICRIHSECLTGDVFGSRRCDCGAQLHEAMSICADQGGIILYMRQEGRGIGLYNKLEAYKLQQEGLDTYKANCQLGFPEDSRNFTDSANMLKALDIPEICLISNNPEKADQLARAGIRVAERLPTHLHETPENKAYLEAKKARGHTFRET